MAEPVGVVTVNLMDGGNGDQPPTSDGAAKMPDWGRHLAQMAQSLSAIQKSVASIQATAQQILGSLNRTGGVASTSASAPASRGAKKDAINVQRIFHVDPRKAIVPMRNVADWGAAAGFPNWARVAEEISRPPDVARISSITSQAASVVEEEVAAVAATAGSPKSASSSPNASKSARESKRGQVRPKQGRRIGSFMGIGSTGSSALYALNNLNLTGGMFGTVLGGGLAVAAAGLSAFFVGRGIIRGADSALRANSLLTPQAASLQAAVDVNRLLSRVSIASNPISRAAMQFYANRSIEAEPIIAATGGAFDALWSYAGGGLKWLYSGWIKTYLPQLWGIMQLAGTATPGGANALFERDIDAMVGGMLSMQDSMRADGMKGNRSINTWDRGTWFSKKKWVQKGRVR